MAPFNHPLLLLVAAATIIPSITHARLELAQTLGSHMVLQRAPHRAAIYGHADPFARVALTLTREAPTPPPNETLTSTEEEEEADPTYARRYSAVANAEGKFTVLLDPVPVKPSTVAPHTITIENARTLENVTLTDVLFGEVWLCSGQSNMQMTVGQCFERDNEGETAEAYPHIRLFTVGTNTSYEPLDDLERPHQPWSVSSREAVLGNDWEHFSAVCFFFGRRLADHLKVPVGLVASSYGGTPIIAWSSPHAVGHCNATTPSIASDASTATTSGMRLRRGPQQPQRQQGQEQQERSGEAAVPPAMGGVGFPSEPSVLYNAMIHPLRKMAFKGAIWYQGETDVGQPDYYECAFPRMIHNWRRLFTHSRVEDAEMGETHGMPFGFVQLASYDSGIGAQGTDIGRMRMAQYSAFEEPHVFMAPAFDLGDQEGGIHPRDKQDLALRLGNAGLFTAYGHGEFGADLGPFISRAVAWKVPDEQLLQVKLVFDNVQYGLTFTDIPNVLEVVLDPSQRDATEGALPVHAWEAIEGLQTGKNDTYIFNFRLPDAPPTNTSQPQSQDNDEDKKETVLLRYGYRNNICPSRETPYVTGIAQASCGVYGKTRTGFMPMLPILKLVTVLPFDPTAPSAAAAMDLNRADVEVTSEA